MRRIRIAVIRHGKKEKINGCGQGTTSWAIQARLTEAGIETAKQLARRLPDCRIFGSSPLLRAQETIFAMMAEQGILASDFAKHIRFDPGFWSAKPETWYLDCKPEEYSNGAIFKLRPAEVIEEGLSVLQATRRLAIIAGLAEQSRAIAVSHGGPLDAAIMVAKEELGWASSITDLKEGEGAFFTFDDDLKIVAVDDFLRGS